MQSVRLTMARGTGGNFFRAGWTYQRLPAGDALLAQGKGLSPAFFNLLDAVFSLRPVSFAELQRAFPLLHADDLELWLAELCRMNLITPASHAEDMRAANEEALEPRPGLAAKADAAPATAAAPAPKQPASEMTFTRLVPITLPEPAKAPAAPAAAPAAATPAAAVTKPFNPETTTDLNFMPVLDFTETGDFAPPVPAGLPHVVEDALPNYLSPPPEGGIAATLKALKHKSLEALYEDLAAICAELEARELSSTALA